MPLMTPKKINKQELIVNNRYNAIRGGFRKKYKKKI